jgi:hypothetical protein
MHVFKSKTESIDDSVIDFDENSFSSPSNGLQSKCISIGIPQSALIDLTENKLCLCNIIQNGSSQALSFPRPQSREVWQRELSIIEELAELEPDSKCN